MELLTLVFGDGVQIGLWQDDLLDIGLLDIGLLDIGLKKSPSALSDGLYCTVCWAISARFEFCAGYLRRCFRCRHGDDPAGQYE